METPELTLQLIDNSIDAIWISVTAYLVFFMETGFSFLEAGNIRFKNIQNVLIKNLLSVTVGTIIYWLIGYSFSFDGDNSFIAGEYFGGENLESRHQYCKWLFHWAFACVCTTIVSGSTAERINFFPYCIILLFVTGWIYPVAVHWNWGEGFLNGWGFKDFAGGGNVHLVGGTSGLVLTLFLGPRKGRFTRKNEEEFAPNNIGYIVLGSFILWLGWYGFNCGSTLSVLGENSHLIGKIGMNTTISGSSCALITLLLNYLENRKTTNRFSIPEFCNGLLAGLVAVTSSCNQIEPWAAFIIGIIGSVIYFNVRKLFLRFKIDDPLSVFPLHGGCGFWGLVSNGFFNNKTGVFYGKGGDFLGIQLAGASILFLWALFWTFLIVLPFKLFKILRISDSEEEMGNDLAKHGGYAFLLDFDKLRGLDDNENPIKVSMLNEITKRKKEEDLKQEKKEEKIDLN